MRRWFWVLGGIVVAAAVLTGVVRARQTEGVPVPARVPVPVSVPAHGAAAGRGGEVSAGEGIVSRTAEAPAASDVSPVGRRVALDTPLFVRFDVDVERGSVERSLVVDPPSAGRIEWLSASELRFVPERWRAGCAYRVRIGGRAKSGEALAPAEWRFRTRVPAPEGIEPGEGKPIVLSFDDGPHKQHQADRLLDVLRDHGAKVVFFPTGRWAKTRKDWVERAVREGHRVCNHTLSHKNLTLAGTTDADIRHEIENGAGDGKCRWFRPPKLGTDQRVERIARSLGYELYLWDVDSRDWEDTPAEDVENLVLSHARPGAVVLLHIHASGTLKALPRILERLTAAGYALTYEGTGPPRHPLVGAGASDTHIE